MKCVAKVVKVDVLHSEMPETIWPEIRVKLDFTVSELKKLLYNKTGTPVEAMLLFVYNSSDEGNRRYLDADEASLESYCVENGHTIFIKVINHENEPTDSCDPPDGLDADNKLLLHYKKQMQRVEKEGTEEVFERYVMSDDEYAKRQTGLKDFINKMRIQKGIAPEKTRGEGADLDDIKLKFPLDSRCLVSPGDVRGTVKFVGRIAKDDQKIKIGVLLDEPFGTCDGSICGTLYFECPPNYGAFYDPDSVTIGDYPPIDPLYIV